MSVDAEGYGFPDHQRSLSRLIDDIRVLSPAGIERAAQGWDRHARLGGTEPIEAAEKAALRAIESANRGPQWDEARRSLFGLTESGRALVSWKVEHGDTGHKAENAALMAALALVAGNLIADEQARSLMRPMAEALPWLLPDEEPEL